MRILAGIALGVFCVLTVGCVDGGVMLQDSVQGEWSNFQNTAHKISQDARPSAEKPAAEK